MTQIMQLDGNDKHHYSSFGSAHVCADKRDSMSNVLTFGIISARDVINEDEETVLCRFRAVIV